MGGTKGVYDCAQRDWVKEQQDVLTEEIAEREVRIAHETIERTFGGDAAQEGDDLPGCDT